MFAEFFARWRVRQRESMARDAAEGTYETIRCSVVVQSLRSQDEVDEAILTRLGTRRSWRRLDESTFEVTWRGAKAEIVVTRPVDPSRFFRDVTEAEIRVFCAGDEDLMPRLQSIGRDTLRALFERDGIPWSPGT